MILILFLGYQFMTVFFLVMGRAIENILFDVLFRVVLDMSPNKQSEGGSGMWQPKMGARLPVISCQSILIGVQSHVARI